jgi:hypothetical protein
MNFIKLLENELFPWDVDTIAELKDALLGAAEPQMA